MMKSLGCYCAVSMAGNNPQTWIPHKPSTICGSAFDVRYSVKSALMHIEVRDQGADFRKAGERLSLRGEARIIVSGGCADCTVQIHAR
jgi:hypothetical protein